MNFQCWWCLAQSMFLKHLKQWSRTQSVYGYTLYKRPNCLKVGSKPELCYLKPPGSPRYLVSAFKTTLQRVPPKWPRVDLPDSVAPSLSSNYCFTFPPFSRSGRSAKFQIYQSTTNFRFSARFHAHCSALTRYYLYNKHSHSLPSNSLLTSRLSTQLLACSALIFFFLFYLS